MIYAILPVATFLYLWMLTAAALPFLALRDRSLAELRKRSMYDKSAGQIRTLAVLMQGISVAALAGDWFGGGAIASFATPEPLRVVFISALIFSVVGMIIMVLAWALARNAARSSSSAFLTGLSGVIACLAAACATLLLWVFLRGGLLVTLGVADGADDAVAAAASFSFAAVWGMVRELAMGPGRIPAALFAVESMIFALAAAQGVTLCWHVLRRKADDFGRDYYAFIVKSRARRAAYAGALTLPVSAVLLWMTPAFAAARLPFLLPLSPEHAFATLSTLSLCLPLAVLCWYLLVRADVPLRKKSLIFLAVPLLYLGVYSLLARLWA